MVGKSRREHKRVRLVFLPWNIMFSMASDNNHLYNAIEVLLCMSCAAKRSVPNNHVIVYCFIEHGILLRAWGFFR